MQGDGAGGGGIAPKKNTMAARMPQLGPSPNGPGLAPAAPLGGGGGGIGSNGLGQVSTKPPQQNLSAFLGADTTYQGQLSAFQKALSDYRANQNTQKTQYLSQYGLDAKNLGQSRQTDEGNLNDDYASRGLLNSGLYGKAFSDLEGQYDQRQTGLDTGRDSFLAQLASAYNDYRSTQQQDVTKAKQDAISRRAAGV